MNALLSYVTPFGPTVAGRCRPHRSRSKQLSHSNGLTISTLTRGIAYFSFYAPPKKLGAATFYVGTFSNAKGDLLRGEESYKLHVPPNVPAQQFWALTLYDRETCGFIRDMPRAGLDSYDQKMQKNPDGSVEIYIGPKPPTGKEGNWIQTAPGRGWFPFFRLYGSEKTFFDETWKLPDIERVN